MRSSSVGRRLADEQVQQRGDGLLHRAVEERGDQVAQGGAARRVARDGGEVDIAQRFLLMPHVALLFEHAQFGADGRIGGRVRQRLVDLAGGGAAARVENVHDLALAPAEVAMSVFAHIVMLQKQQHGVKVAPTRTRCQGFLARGIQ